MSLYQHLLSLITSAPVQHERLIRLHTPLGPDVLLAERMRLREHVGPTTGGGLQTPAGLHADVHALAADTHLELKTLIGQPAQLQLELADGRLRTWHSHITDIALLGSDGGLARYRLTLQPWLAFLGHRQDSWVFQHQSVPQIIDEVFADYVSAGSGPLAPAWRWELADASVYAQRSLCIQYQETDLAFVQRLLLEEGLFCWWEHSESAHTLVMADHNHALTPSTQPRVRYTQAHASLPEDSLVRWSEQFSVHPAQLRLASQDHRANAAGRPALRPVSEIGLQDGQPLPEAQAGLSLSDVPGLYAYPSLAQGQRLVRRQMEALDALRHTARARGSLRQAAPATRFTLADHPDHRGDAPGDEFIVLGVQHTARSNLRADLKAQVHRLLGAIALDRAGPRGLTSSLQYAGPNATEEPLHTSLLTLQPAAVPVRLADAVNGQPEVRWRPRPRVHGVQTAIVVGSGGPVHTDRDHRIQVQFHWQRGLSSSHRLDAPAGSNAPGNERSGTWVRVAESWAGANWGSHFIPRVGQEVVVTFLGGDIDRPLVLGAVYNGQGQPDAQGNQVPGGSVAAAGATGNAPAWFPGNKAVGPHPGYRHPMVLAGHKSQELGASASGQGGYNQLVLDDTPGQGRIELSTTTAATRLQLGHLLQQTDNQRLNPRGHGVDLSTQAWGALRAGSGLLISAHGRAGGSLAAGSSQDAREPEAQLAQSRELVHALAESAQQHRAKLKGEPDVLGATEQDTARQLPVEQALWASQHSLQGQDQRGGGEGSANGIGGGLGTVVAWTRPDLVLAAPGGIGSHTPAHSLHYAGHTASWVAGQDLQYTAQGNFSNVVKGGLVIYTFGQASNKNKPNQETGIRLHAASGNVNVQAQKDAMQLTADQSVKVASTTGMVRITAPAHVLLAAAGAAIELKGDHITLSAPGHVKFKATMRELAGPVAASQSLVLKQPGVLKGCAQRQVKGLDAITEF